MQQLQVTPRQQLGTKQVKTLREQGYLPAILYGRKEESTAVMVDFHEFKKVYREAGESSIITLTGLDDEKEALIQDTDIDPLTDEPRHVDFYVTEKGRTLTISVPLEFEGTAPAEKELGGTLVKVMHEVEIETLPHNLPQHLTVQIEGLKDFDSQITAGDIELPDGVTLSTDPEEVVALVSETTEEPEESEGEGMSMEDVEVEQKGKQEEEEATEA
jgi:large subunit ribosomal protein L25